MIEVKDLHKSFGKFYCRTGRSSCDYRSIGDGKVYIFAMSELY